MCEKEGQRRIIGARPGSALTSLSYVVVRGNSIREAFDGNYSGLFERRMLTQSDVVEHPVLYE